MNHGVSGVHAEGRLAGNPPAFLRQLDVRRAPNIDARAVQILRLPDDSYMSALPHSETAVSHLCGVLIHQPAGGAWWF